MVSINREDLERVYIKENKTRKETADYFGVKPYVISNYVVQYGLRKESQEEVLAKTLKTFSREKVEELYQNHSHSEMAKILGVTEDILNAVLRKYKLGKRSICINLQKQYSKEDLEEMYLKKNMSLIEVAEVFQTDPQNVRKILRFYRIRKPKDKVLQNIQKTWKKRYGTVNLNTVPEIVEKKKKTCLEKYGAECVLVSPHCYSEFRNNSKPNQKFAKLLEKYGIEFEREFPIKSKSYDFKVGNKLVEINPYSTHNSTWGIRKGSKGKDPQYHWEKSQLAKENNFQCIHVFDWDDRDKIIKLLLPRKTLYARKLQVRKISQKEANKLLKEEHLQGGASLQTVCLGLFQGEDLIEVMTFGKPRFNKNYEWELIRLCTRSGYCVVGGAERLFKHFVDKDQPKSIISYCDNAKFTGNVYTRLGFVLKGSKAISRHWYSPQLKMHITDNGLRMRGFDKLLGNIYGKFGKGTSNDELMREHGFVEIYDAGQSVYEWKQ